MRFLIADDHLLARAGLTSLLEAEGHTVVGACDSGESAIRDTLRLQPDVVLLDIRMPGMNGLDALRLIKEKAPHVKVVIVTIAEDEEYVLEAIRRQANGFLLKSSCGEEFLNCIQALEKGNLAISPYLATRVINILMHENQAQDHQAPKLTPRQVEILRYTAHGLSNKEIGNLLMVSENTVKYHLKQILQKLNAQNRTEAVAVAISFGLLEAAAETPEPAQT